ncbi:MAG: DNA polymerase III subunit gamma/tau [Pirellulales bacterium]|nr:DNA polymerase III subunit gamma/tau [Pirellulales bacterium]
MDKSSQSLPAEKAAAQYVVVARRYRPQTFDELIGQEHVAKALKGAIASERVGHAYLFTGARGVGKTSAARILAKALNCARGTSPTPCNECEICHSIASGDDVDVLEIDGASNRGIDEIRQLRQNVAVRPARARFKIYIIDEVHMLTKEAFNALLKTLEEPPEHVKFIFATTEPNKIPITILSRCQRYDFAGIDAAAIHARLDQIADAEGVVVEPDALQIIAMRAAGSMRDSQSLLEQLLSSGKRQITAADVTGLLGLAPASRLTRLVAPLVEGNAAAALTELDAAIAEGAEVGQLIDQLLGYFRDVMTQAVGCGVNQLLYALPGQREEIQAVAQRLGIQTLLAMSQVLDQTAARLRVSTQVRTLAEMALVRICHLQDLDEISALIQQLSGGDLAAPGAAQPLSMPGAALSKKNGLTEAPGNGRRPASPTAAGPAVQPRAALGGNAADRSGAPAQAGPHADFRPEAQDAAEATTLPATSGSSNRVELQPAAAEEVWRAALERLAGITADCAAAATRISIDAQGRLVASFPECHKFSRDACLRPTNLSRLEAALAEVAGGRVPLVLTTHHDPNESAAAATPQRTSAKQQQADAAAEPFVQRAVELFDADASRMRFVAPPSDGTAP